MIPRVCYFYWGGGPLSYLQHLSIKSFQRYNPDWRVVLLMPKIIKLVKPNWQTGELLDEFTGEDYLERTKAICEVEVVDFDAMELNWREAHDVQKGDWLKWHILYERGGIFSDIDILYVKSVDELLSKDFDSAICYITHPATGFLIAKPQQKMFGDFAKIAEDLWQRHMWATYQGLGPDVLSNRFGSAHDIELLYPDSKIYNLPMNIVYPYRPNAEVYELFFGDGIDRTTDETVGIHWYNGNFVSREYQNRFLIHRQNGSYMSKLIKEY